VFGTIYRPEFRTGNVPPLKTLRVAFFGLAAFLLSLEAIFLALSPFGRPLTNSDPTSSSMGSSAPLVWIRRPAQPRSPYLLRRDSSETPSEPPRETLMVRKPLGPEISIRCGLLRPSLPVRHK